MSDLHFYYAIPIEEIDKANAALGVEIFGESKIGYYKSTKEFAYMHAWIGVSPLEDDKVFEGLTLQASLSHDVAWIFQVRAKEIIRDPMMFCGHGRSVTLR